MRASCRLIIDLHHVLEFDDMRHESLSKTDNTIDGYNHTTVYNPSEMLPYDQCVLNFIANIMYFNQGPTASKSGHIDRHVVHHVSSIVPVLAFRDSSIEHRFVDWTSSEHNSELCPNTTRSNYDSISGVARAFPVGESPTRKAKMRKKISKVWGKTRKVDRNLRKNEESGILAHPGLWGWPRPWIPSNQQNQTRNRKQIKMIPQSQGADLHLFRPFKIRIFAWFRVKKWVKITVCSTHIRRLDAMAMRFPLPCEFCIDAAPLLLNWRLLHRHHDT